MPVPTRTDDTNAAALLTIAIPTFDRVVELSETLTALAPQLDARVKLVVLDNASPTPAVDIVADLGLSDVVSVVRQPMNLGSLANVMRCFELATTPWLWILPDDDRVMEDAVSTILDRVGAHRDAMVLAFPSIRPPGVEAHGNGWDEFLESGILWTDIQFLPTMIYSMEAVREHVRIGYFAGLGGHAVTLRASLGDDGHFVVFDTKLVERMAPRDGGWNLISFQLWSPLVLDHINDDDGHRKVAQMLAVQLEESLLTTSRRISAAFPSEPAYSRYLFDQVFWRFRYYDRSVGQTIRWIVLRTHLAHPGLVTFVRALSRPSQFRSRMSARRATSKRDADLLKRF